MKNRFACQNFDGIKGKEEEQLIEDNSLLASIKDLRQVPPVPLLFSHS